MEGKPKRIGSERRTRKSRRNRDGENCNDEKRVWLEKSEVQQPKKKLNDRELYQK